MLAIYGIFSITFWFGIKEYTKGKIPNVGDITVVLFLVIIVVINIGRIASPIIAIVKASTTATKLFIIINTLSLNISGSKEPKITTDANITFKDIAFSYLSRPNV
ncbi:hypothetical protein V2W45_1229766 [Cenococcum geophilum]